MSDKLYIKNMVCDRCILVVKTELEKLNIPYKEIQLGEVTLINNIADTIQETLKATLTNLGFEIIDDKKRRISEKVKNTIIQLIHQQDLVLPNNLSDILTDTLHLDYNYISNLFSETEGTTIEKYFIAQKIERVKELLKYDELTLSEIANQMNYSSVAYLSNQFKKITGITPSNFKQNIAVKRKPLDKV